MIKAPSMIDENDAASTGNDPLIKCIREICQPLYRPVKREPHQLLAQISFYLGTDCKGEHFTSGQSSIAGDLTEFEGGLLIQAIRDMIVQSKLKEGEQQ